METKKRYIPEGYVEYKPEIGGYKKDLFACYVKFNHISTTGRTFHCAMFFVGKQSKPIWHYRFDTIDAIKEKVNGAISNLMAWEDSKQKRKVARNTPHTLKLGDILYASWGYDQTNIDFYQVTAVVGAYTVEIAPVHSAIVDHEGGGSNKVVAVRDSFKKDEKPMIKRVRDNTTVSIKSYSTASLWDGRPLYETALGWGH